MRKRRWGCLVVLVALVLCVAVVLSGALRPEPAPEDLRQRARAAPALDSAVHYTVGGVVVDGDRHGVPGVPVEVFTTDHSARWETLTGPDGRFAVRGVAGLIEVRPMVPTVPVSKVLWIPKTNLRFLLAEHCGMEVGVVAEDQGVSGATVRLRVGGEAELEAETDEEGRVVWESVPCGEGTLEVHADGYLSNTAPLHTAEGHAWIHLLARDHGFVRVHGWVEAGGQPVDRVELGVLPVRGSIEGHSGADGAYSLFVPGPGPYVLYAEHHEHQHELDSIIVPPGVAEWAHDVELEPIRKVKVYCAGMPDDGCYDLPLVMCTEPWAPASFPCVEEGGVMTCRCPLGEAAVRGGGQSVLIGPDEDEAWLDLRAPGGIRGTVHVDGEPSGCTLEVVRWSLELAGGGGLRTHACGPDGSFVVPSLQEGSWRVVVRAEGLETAVGPVDVSDEVVDVGTVDLTGGAMLAGRVVWEEDDEPVVGVGVAAVELAALTSGEAPPVGTAVTDEHGAFAIFGLEPGRYEVLLPRDPGSAQVVELDDEDAFVELVREGGSGLRLARDDEDRLVVAEGDAEGWLQAGDRIERVEVAGVDLLPMLPRYGDDVGETILGMVGWPGLVVEVDREGKAVVIGEE